MIDISPRELNILSFALGTLHALEIKEQNLDGIKDNLFGKEITAFQNKMNKYKDELNTWISVFKELPKIPKNRYAVSVLINVIDDGYNPLVSDVYQASFIDGKFKSLLIPSGEWMEIMDHVTHWQYLPPEISLKQIHDWRSEKDSRNKEAKTK